MSQNLKVKKMDNAERHLEQLGILALVEIAGPQRNLVTIPLQIRGENAGNRNEPDNDPVLGWRER